jgi:hypothetical protein
MSVTAQGNSFGGNAVGVLIVGDGYNAGAINLGGVNGNPGGNDFSDYQGNDGRLAIAMVNADVIVDAGSNIWATYPGNVVKDANYNSNQQTTPDYTANQFGTGSISLGQGVGLFV